MNKPNKNKIFISWSGESGKEIAQKLKEVLENDVFSNKLKCFVSDSDIASGEDWWNKIKSELTSSLMGIICITKENIKAPWIYYEAGALVGNDVKTIPLLFNCKFDILSKTPLSGNQAVTFQDRKKFVKMINDINEQFNILNVSKDNIKIIASLAHEKIHRELKDVFERLKQRGYFSETYVYPENVQTMDRNSVFVSALMSALKSDEYEKQRKSLQDIVESLQKIGFSKVICPAAEIEDKNHFEGRTKSVIDNFRNLKQAECFVLIYEFSRASSALVELGYAIAVGKKVVVFYKSKLPFLIQKAGESIPHVHTVQFRNFKMIHDEIIGNNMTLFGKEKEDNE